jgi:hypothetical protein
MPQSTPTATWQTSHTLQVQNLFALATASSNSPARARRRAGRIPALL